MPKIKNEIDCKLTTRVTYTEGSTPVVRVTASAVYDEATNAYTSVDLDVDEAVVKQIQVLLDKVFAGCASQVAHNINDAIHTSRKVGQTHGEIK